MAANGVTYTGLDALLTPERSVLLLIDHQGAQFAGMHSMDPNLVVNNVTALAKGAKLFEVPTILSTVVEDRGGRIIRQIQDVFPDQCRSIAPRSTPGRTNGSSMPSPPSAARTSS